MAAVQPGQHPQASAEDDQVKEQGEGRAEQAGEHHAQPPADDAAAAAGAGNSAEFAVPAAEVQDGQQGQEADLQGEDATRRELHVYAQARQQNQNTQDRDAQGDQQAAVAESAGERVGPGVRDRRVRRGVKKGEEGDDTEDHEHDSRDFAAPGRHTFAQAFEEVGAEKAVILSRRVVKRRVRRGSLVAA